MVKKRSLCIALASVVAVTSMCLLMGVRDAKAQSMDDLMKRIEALEARSTGNVTAPKIRGLKIGFDMRHRFEIRSEGFTTAIPDTHDDIPEPFLQSNITGFSNPGLVDGVRYVDVTNDGLGDAGTVGATGRQKETQDITLQRIRLSLDADVNKNVRAFINLQDQRIWGVEGHAFPPTGTLGGEARVDLLEAYVDLRNLGDLSPMLKNIDLRVGRWQWFYGNHRLIGHLNWTNQGRSYNGTRLKWKDEKGNWVDLFAASIEEVGPGTPGSEGVIHGGGFSDLDEVLYGVYGHFKVHDGNVFEPYVIRRSRSAETKWDSDGATNDTGEQRTTVGFRLDGRKIPGLGGLDYTVEPAWQFGTVEGLRSSDLNKVVNNGGSDTSDSESIQAWALYAGVGYTFKEMPWTPRIGYAYVFASGDKRPDMGSAKTFDHLYPTGHAQLGYIDYAAWQNIEDHQIHLNFKPTKKLVCDVKFHFFSLDEEADRWYSVAGGTGWGGGAGTVRFGADQKTVFDSTTGTFGGAGSVDDELGQEIDITVKYKLFENFGVVAGYSHFFAGDFIEDTGNGIDRGVDWCYLQTTMKF